MPENSAEDNVYRLTLHSVLCDGCMNVVKHGADRSTVRRSWESRPIHICRGCWYILMQHCVDALPGVALVQDHLGEMP